MAANQEPHYLRAARLWLAARSGMLATVHEGQPHASLVTPGLSPDGAPLLLLSSLAAHTRHLLAAPACALLVTGAAETANPQTMPRLTLSGTAVQVPAAAAREAYLRTHPYAAAYENFGDFSYWKINVSTLLYIGGFAQAASLNVAAVQHEISGLLRAG